jgi:hypothetical protein
MEAGFNFGLCPVEQMTSQVPTETMDPGARGSVSSNVPLASCRVGLGLSLE